MVKNTTGGSKAKGQARKVGSGGQTHRLHISHDELEVYAVAVRAYGNAMFEVLGVDNVKRLCHIRGKFKGRGKRDNFISVGMYLLVGLREWESQDALIAQKKLPNCDLIAIYSDQDKDRLKNAIYQENDIYLDLKSTLVNKIKYKTGVYPFIDIFFMVPEIENGQTVYKCALKEARDTWKNEVYLEKELFPLKETKFGAMEIAIPNEYNRYFLSYFGKNWNKEGVISYDHKKEEFVNPIIKAFRI
jgi:translation initiation factor IF-1